MVSSFNQIAAGARGDGASSDFDNQGRSCVLVGIVFRSDKGEQGRTRKDKEEQRSTGDREVEASPHLRERINSLGWELGNGEGQTRVMHRLRLLVMPVRTAVLRRPPGPLENPHCYQPHSGL